MKARAYVDEHSYILFPPQFAQAMLYIQENSSNNTSRAIRSLTFLDTVKNMIKLYSEIRVNMEGNDESIFDIQDLITYYEGVSEIQYFEEIPTETEIQSMFGDCDVRNMKVYSRKMLLDGVVDYLTGEIQTEMNPEENC